MCNEIELITLQIVIIGVLSHAPVEERPREIIHSVLFVLDRFGDNLGVEMIVETVIQMTLDGQRFVQELFVKIFLRRLTEQDALGVIVFPRSISSTNSIR